MAVFPLAKRAATYLDSLPNKLDSMNPGRPVVTTTLRASPEARGGSAGHLRLQNLERILSVVIERQDSFTRAELIEATGLSAPTVGSLVSDLIRIGLVKDLGAGPSRGGRRPSFMEFNARHGFVGGIDLGPTKTRLARGRPARRAPGPSRHGHPHGPGSERASRPSRGRSPRSLPRSADPVRPPARGGGGGAGRRGPRPRNGGGARPQPQGLVERADGRDPAARSRRARRGRERREPRGARRALAGRRPRPRHVRRS